MDSDSNSDASSVRSQSPSESPAASFHTPPAVEQLVQYFVSAKRALSATNYVWRANELVTTSRTLLEEIALLDARNTFAQRAVDEQVGTLHDIRDEIVATSDDAGDDFDGTLVKLDAANDRLESTLASLKKTIVDASLQNTSNNVENDADGVDDAENSTSNVNAEKTLYDFIDETSHTDVQALLRTLIDSFNDSRADLNATIDNFGDSLRTITETVSDSNKDNPAEEINTIYDEPPPTIPHLFHSMEDHATEMATLLQSLVSHYDLCVTALKHTEGGGEAAKKAIQQAEEALAKNPAGGVEESLYLKSAPEPISSEDRNEMLRVVENDAQEVDDVVNEIKDRNRDQESQYERLSRHVNKARTKNQTLRNVLDMLHEMKDIHLPSHIHALTTFKSSWQRIQTSIDSQTAELATLSSFYDSFLTGYARLLREVDRRRAAEMQMRKVVEKAMKELDRLHEADRAHRADFMDDTGKYLPHGIWPGLTDEPLRWDVTEVGRNDALESIQDM